MCPKGMRFLVKNSFKKKERLVKKKSVLESWASTTKKNERALGPHAPPAPPVNLARDEARRHAPVGAQDQPARPAPVLLDARVQATFSNSGTSSGGESLIMRWILVRSSSTRSDHLTYFSSHLPNQTSMSRTYPHVRAISFPSASRNRTSCDQSGMSRREVLDAALSRHILQESVDSIVVCHAFVVWVFYIILFYPRTKNFEGPRNMLDRDADHRGPGFTVKKGHKTFDRPLWGSNPRPHR
jgi:hypothetical protein